MGSIGTYGYRPLIVLLLLEFLTCDWSDVEFDNAPFILSLIISVKSSCCCKYFSIGLKMLSIKRFIPVPLARSDEVIEVN